MKKKIKEWPHYIVLFIALWAGNIVIDLAPRVPIQELKRIALRGLIVPALIATVLFFVHSGNDTKD